MLVISARDMYVRSYVHVLWLYTYLKTLENNSNWISQTVPKLQQVQGKSYHDLRVA